MTIPRVKNGSSGERRLIENRFPFWVGFPVRLVSVVGLCSASDDLFDALRFAMLTSP